MLCVCLSGRPHTGAGGLVLIEHIMVYLVYSRHIQPTCQEAQWHLPLIVAVMLLTLPSYCLVSWSKPQHGGRAESSSVGTDTLCFPGCHSHACFQSVAQQYRRGGRKSLLKICHLKLIYFKNSLVNYSIVTKTVFNSYWEKIRLQFNIAPRISQIKVL